MITVETIEQVRELMLEGPVFVRWSGGPDADADMGWVSKNHQNGDLEPGLSVNDLPDDSNDYEVLQRITEYRFGGLPVCYLCKGTVAGLGSDGEPCLSDVEVLAIVGEGLTHATIEQKEKIRLNTAIQKEQQRLERITDRIAIRGTVEDLLLYRRQLAALEAGEPWAWGVEKYKKDRLPLEWSVEQCKEVASG